MRKLRVPLFLLGIFMSIVSCQQGFDSDSSLETNEKSISELKARSRSSAKYVFMPLDSVPEWVRDKTTYEEYELWKIMSTRYQINYSFLDMNLRDDQRIDLFNTLKAICEKIKEGSLETEERNLGYFVVQTLKKNSINGIERLSRSESGETAHQSYPEIIYEAESTSFAFVRIVATFYTNSEGEEISKVGGAKAYADGLNAIKFEGSCSTGDFGPLILNVKCSGTLTYRSNGKGGESSESFSRSLNIKVLPG